MDTLELANDYVNLPFDAEDADQGKARQRARRLQSCGLP